MKGQWNSEAGRADCSDMVDSSFNSLREAVARNSTVAIVDADDASVGGVTLDELGSETTQRSRHIFVTDGCAVTARVIDHQMGFRRCRSGICRARLECCS